MRRLATTQRTLPSGKLCGCDASDGLLQLKQCHGVTNVGVVVGEVDGHRIRVVRADKVERVDETLCRREGKTLGCQVEG